MAVEEDGEVYFLKKFPAVVVRLEATFCVFPEATEVVEVTASVTSEFFFKACCSSVAEAVVAMAEGVIMVIL